MRLDDIKSFKSLTTLDSNISSATTNQYVPYNDYIKLHMKYKVTALRLSKAKKENCELKAALNEMQSQIKLFTMTKDSLVSVIEQVKGQCTVLLTERESTKGRGGLSLSCFDLMYEPMREERRLTERQKEGNERLKTLREEYIKGLIMQNSSTANSTNGKNDKALAMRSNVIEMCLGSVWIEYDDSDGVVNDNNDAKGKEKEEKFVNHSVVQCEPIPSMFKCLKKCF